MAGREREISVGERRRLALPKRIETWSLTSFQQRLVKTGGSLVKHGQYYWLLLAENDLIRRLFGSMVRHRRAAAADWIERGAWQAIRSKPRREGQLSSLSDKSFQT